MSLDVAYFYCIHLTGEEKLKIDKQVQKNIFKEYLVCFNKTRIFAALQLFFTTPHLLHSNRLNWVQALLV